MNQMKKGRVKNYLVLVGVAMMLSACKKQVTWQDQYDLGMKYLGEGSYQEAVTAFQQAIALDANQQSVYIGTADAYVGLAQSGDEGLDIAKCCDTAEQNYQKALEFDDSTEEIYTKLADVYLLSGDMEKAQEILDTGKEKVSSSDGKLDEKMQQVLDEIAKNMPNISEYQEQGYVLTTFRSIPTTSEKFGVLAIKEGTDADCLLAVVDIRGSVYAAYQYSGRPKAGIAFLDEQTIYYATENGYVLRLIKTGEDVTDKYVESGERIVNIESVNHGVSIITQETLSDGENRVRIYDEKGTCLLSCVDRDLEEKAVGTSMEGIKCNWDFDQIYYYRNYKENVGDSSTIWYCNKDTRHGYKWSDKGRDAVYVGHVLLLPDIQDAFIVPSEVTREIGTNSVSIRLLNECKTNGEIVLYNNHKLDISKRDFDTAMDYIPDITEEDAVFFANPDVIEVQKREGEEFNCYYYQVGEKQGQLLDENENYKGNCDFYDGIALKHIVGEDGTAAI